MAASQASMTVLHRAVFEYAFARFGNTARFGADWQPGKFGVGLALERTMAPNHFTRVALRNFKGHAHTDVPLSQFTLLVGANGTGKTSVLQAVHLVSGALATLPGTEEDWGSGAPFHDGLEVDLIRRSLAEGTEPTEGPDDLEITVEFGGGPASIGLRLSGPPLKATVLIGESPRWLLLPQPKPPEVVAALGAVLLRLDTHAIVTPSQSQFEGPIIGADGSGLAPALKHFLATAARP